MAICWAAKLTKGSCTNTSKQAAACEGARSARQDFTLNGLSHRKTCIWKCTASIIHNGKSLLESMPTLASTTAVRLLEGGHDNLVALRS